MHACMHANRGVRLKMLTEWNAQKHSKLLAIDILIPKPCAQQIKATSTTQQNI